jgi:hypothetical protein
MSTRIAILILLFVSITVACRPRGEGRQDPANPSPVAPPSGETNGSPQPRHSGKGSAGGSGASNLPGRADEAPLVRVREALGEDGLLGRSWPEGWLLDSGRRRDIDRSSRLGTFLLCGESSYRAHDLRPDRTDSGRKPGSSSAPSTGLAGPTCVGVRARPRRLLIGRGRLFLQSAYNSFDHSSGHQNR